MTLSFCPRCEAGVWYGIEHRCSPMVGSTTTGASVTLTFPDGGITGSGENRRVIQYGVRMGDGEVPHVYSNQQDAFDAMHAIAERITSGEWEADDYEPMTVVRRSHTVLVSPWVEAT